MRAPFQSLTPQPEELVLSFSYKCAAGTGAASNIIGDGGSLDASGAHTGGMVKSIAAMSAGVQVVQLNTPYPPQMLSAIASPAKNAGAGTDGNTCEVPIADYDPAAGTFKIYYIVQDGTPAVGTVPAADARINVRVTFERRKALKSS